MPRTYRPKASTPKTPQKKRAGSPSCSTQPRKRTAIQTGMHSYLRQPVFDFDETDEAATTAEPAETVEATEAEDAVVEAAPLSDKDRAELRAFDLAQAFGPCVGITRKERWRRADALGRNPPQRVREILAAMPEGSDEADSMLSKYSL